MSDNWTRRFLPVGVVAMLAGNALAGYTVLRAPAAVPTDQRVGAPMLGFLLASLLFAMVGLLIARRQPRNPIGWMLLAIGICIPLGSANQYAINATYAPAEFPAVAWVQLIGRMASLAAIPLVVTSFLFFPEGRLLSARWRWFVWLAAGLGGVLELALAIDPNADTPPSPLSIHAAAGVYRIVDALGGALLVTAAAGVVSLILRYRRGGSDTRHQLKWVLAALALFVTCLAFAFAAPALLGAPTWVTDIAVGLGYPVPPLAIGIAVLKYRLYDIDLLISRALVYGALAAFITAVYVGIVVGVGTLVGSGGKPNLALSIVATAIVAVAFQPVRERRPRCGFAARAFFVPLRPGRQDRRATEAAHRLRSPCN